ncbi:MAG: circularly permuted type 2 ATP-grasp protein [Planctomycetaceae bacterium]
MNPLLDTSPAAVIPGGATGSAGGPFPGYAAAATAYDEFRGADGGPRPHWRGLVEQLGAWQPSELADRWEQARRLIRDNGVTYAMQDEQSGEQRPWVLDPIPLIIAGDDWARLEVGINQRARVLEALLADLYGPQHVLHEGLVPPELVFGHPGFLRCCHGVPVPGGRRLHLYAAVVARNHDGRWVALGDRTDVPRGLGYALENRLVVSRLFPAAFEQCHVERLAPFFIGLRSLLRGLAPGRDDPRIALQSPGPASPTYFEDAYLARYLGFPLVEGGDLAVRDDRLGLKTLGGLVPQDVLLRRVADRLCDPLELDSAALEGTPGLVQAVRRGRVAVANALGASLVESPGFAEFLPAVSRRLLGEDLALAAPRSWWCGIPANLDHVLQSLDTCVIEPARPGRGPKRFVPALLDAAARARLVDEIRSRPADWVGRERVERSVAPCWSDGAIAPASVLMRCFAVAVPEGYQTMRGALARMATGRSSGEELLLSSQGSKDVWVLASGPVAPLTLLRRPGQSVPLRRSGYDLPSRVADHLHWLGRHAERAENAARLLRTVATRLASESHADCAAAAAALLGAVSADAPRGPGLPDLHAEIQPLVHDPHRAGSVRSEIDRLWKTASVVRDRISIDSWKVLARVRRDSFGGRGLQRSRGGPVADVLPHLDALIFDLSAFAGLGTENMTRGPGWRFLDMGRRIERASFAITLLATGLAALRPQAFGDGQRADAVRLEEMLLEIADSSMTYRNRYPGVMEAAPLVDLLVIDETNPRSVAFQFAALADHVAALPRDDASPVPSGEQRAVMAAVSRLRLADVERLAAVDDHGGRRDLATLLGGLETLVREFAEAVSHRYLVHSTPRRQLGDPASGA